MGLMAGGKNKRPRSSAAFFAISGGIFSAQPREIL
jgi:hypothetical protein